MIIIFITLYYSALLGGRSISEKKIKVTDGEQRQLVDNIFFFKQSSQQLSSDGSRILWGLREFLTKT